MQHQDANLTLGRVAELARLGAGTGERYGDVASARRARFGKAREREDVGGRVLAAKLAVQAAHVGIPGDEAIKRSAARDLCLQLPRKAEHGGRTHLGLPT